MFSSYLRLQTRKRFNANNQLIAFSNNAVVGANATTAMTPYRYVNVITIGGQAVDAILSVTAVSSGATIQEVDAQGAPSGATNAMINSTVNMGGSTDYLTYKIDFVEGGTSTPITLQNVAISVGDIDIQQFAQFNGITSYKLSTSPATRLTAQTNTGTVPAGSYRFQSTSTQSTAANEENWVEVRYAQTNSIEITLGAIVSGGAYFSIDFQPSNWTAVTTTSGTTNPAPTHTLSYDPNSGTGTAPSSTTGTGSVTTAPAGTGLTRPGFTFAGWNTNPNGTGTSYQPGDALDLSTDITLYAMWTPALASTGFSENKWGALPLGTVLLIIGLGLLAVSKRSRIVRRSNFNG